MTIALTTRAPLRRRSLRCPWATRQVASPTHSLFAWRRQTRFERPAESRRACRMPLGPKATPREPVSSTDSPGQPRPSHRSPNVVVHARQHAEAPNHLYVQSCSRRTIEGMDVAISDLRSHLSAWVDRVQAGEEVVITERGVPVARMTAIDAAPVLRRLTDEGVVAAPTSAARASASSSARVKATASVAERVADQRR